MTTTHGKVFLVGAGPGDPELLTLKAVKALARADVILIDALVNHAVLEFARSDVRVVEVGKRCGCKSASQTFIHKQMITAARAGKVVVRLKGGDPFVFGRGGEELEALRAAKVHVEIISGVTAGIGVPAALGIPVTHRDFVHGVSFVTGHAREDLQPDWNALAHSGTTLVIYMGLKNLNSIVTRLLTAGMPGTTPTAIIENGTLPEQRYLISRLADLAEVSKQPPFSGPTILVVGEVVSLAQPQIVTRFHERAA